MTFACGKVGAVTVLIVFFFVDPSTFFLVIADAAVVALTAAQFPDEPRVQTIDVNR